MKQRIVCFMLVVMLLVVTIGAEAKQITCSFQQPGTKLMVDFDAEVDDSLLLFHQPSNTYQHELAKLSLCMTVSAFRDSKAELSSCDHNIRSFFSQMGFENYEAYAYGESPKAHTISSAIASKCLTDEDGKAYVLVASPVCGQGYGNEWIGNFEVGDGEQHDGFMIAAEQVYSRIVEYVERYYPGERVKVWVSGFSRAAAVSNLTGSLLLEDNRFEDNDIFVYTFATPNTTRTPVAYPQIYNICGSFDPVTHMPLSDWGYGKHGTTFYLPSRETSDHYDDLFLKRKAFIDTIRGAEHPYTPNHIRNWLTGKLLAIMADYVPDAKSFSRHLQDAIQAALATQGSASDKLNAFVSAAESNGAAEMKTWDYLVEELVTLVNFVLVDTLQTADTEGGNSVWVDLLSEGVGVAGEHFPSEYVGWMMSGIVPEQLFGSGYYVRFVIPGDMDICIEQYNQNSNQAAVIYDSANDNGTVACIQVRNTKTIRLPAFAERAYVATLTAQCDTDTQIAVGLVPLKDNITLMSTTQPVSVNAGDSLYAGIKVAADYSTYEAAVVDWDFKELPFASHNASDYDMVLMLREVENANEQLAMKVTGIIVLVLYLVGSLMVLLYAISVGAKRIVRGKVENRASYRMFGSVVMYVAAAAAFFFAVVYARGLLIKSIVVQDTILGSHKTMAAVTKYMGIGTELYLISGFFLHIMLAIECIISVRYQLARIRVLRLSVLMIFQDILALLVAQGLNTQTVFENLQLFVPVVALIGLGFVRVPGKSDEFVGKTWLPVSRAAVVTLLLFAVREVLLFFEIWNTQSIGAVALKSMTCFPALLLSVYCAKKNGDVLHKTTMFALLCYTIGNGIINMSMIAGIVFFCIGHLLMMSGFFRKHKPTLLEWLISVAVTAGFGLEMYYAGGALGAEILPYSILYVFAISIVTVCSFSINRRINAGYVMFLISDVFLMLYLLCPGAPVLDAITLLLFYSAMIVIAASPEALRSRFVAKKMN